jgi:hypothetical protein
MFRSFFSRSPTSPSNLNSDSFIKREFDAASSNAEKNKSIRIKKVQLEKFQVPPSTSPRPNQCPSVRSTAPSPSPVHERVDWNFAATSPSPNKASRNSREQSKHLIDEESTSLDEQQAPDSRGQVDASGTSQGPIEDLFGHWTNAIKGAIFPEKEDNTKGGMFETRLHNGQWLVLL